jgi:AbrB family looped-hinge helix DNA binding protein
MADMIIMKNQSNQKLKLRAVMVNDRGQIVIPDDIRRELGIEAGTALVLVQKGKEILIRKESDFLKGMGR